MVASLAIDFISSDIVESVLGRNAIVPSKINLSSYFLLKCQGCNWSKGIDLLSASLFC
jgi:hypothetical protein